MRSSIKLLLAVVLLLLTLTTKAQSLSHDKWTNALCGEWLGKGVVMGDSVVYSATTSYCLSDQFICIHLRDTARKAAYMADIYIGYDSTKNEYICHWLDDSGTANSTVLGHGKKSTDQQSVNFAFEYPGSPMQTSIGLTKEGWAFQAIFITARGTPQIFGTVYFTRK